MNRNLAHAHEPCLSSQRQRPPCDPTVHAPLYFVVSLLFLIDALLCTLCICVTNLSFDEHASTWCYDALCTWLLSSWSVPVLGPSSRLLTLAPRHLASLLQEHALVRFGSVTRAPGQQRPLTHTTYKLGCCLPPPPSTPVCGVAVATSSKPLGQP
jgi:hypothetical protein